MSGSCKMMRSCSVLCHCLMLESPRRQRMTPWRVHYSRSMFGTRLVVSEMGVGRVRTGVLPGESMLRAVLMSIMSSSFVPQPTVPEDLLNPNSPCSQQKNPPGLFS